MGETEIGRLGTVVEAAARLITGWAILGGIVLTAVVAMNVASVLGGIFWVPFPGDFELTQIGVAIAAFTFLPYCQLTGGNVTADIFSSRAGPRLLAIFSMLASIIAFLFSILLLWRMWGGMLDQKTYGYVTAIVQFPVWIAYIPILVSMFLLAVAAAITLIDGDRSVEGHESHG